MKGPDLSPPSRPTEPAKGGSAMAPAATSFQAAGRTGQPEPISRCSGTSAGTRPWAATEGGAQPAPRDEAGTAATEVPEASGADVRMSDESPAPAAREIPAELLTRPFLLHRCEAAGCEGLAYGRHCESHETPEDREWLRALRLALLEATEAEERWREARERVVAAERAAGVRRASVVSGGQRT